MSVIIVLLNLNCKSATQQMKSTFYKKSENNPFGKRGNLIRYFKKFQ